MEPQCRKAFPSLGVNRKGIAQEKSARGESFASSRGTLGSFLATRRGIR